MVTIIARHLQQTLHAKNRGNIFFPWISLIYSKIFSISILAIWIPRANVKLSVKSWIILLFVEKNFINFSHWILHNQIYEPNLLLLNNVIAYTYSKENFQGLCTFIIHQNNCCIRNYIRTVFATNLQRIRLVETNDSSLFHYLSKESHHQTR